MTQARVFPLVLMEQRHMKAYRVVLAAPAERRLFTAHDGRQLSLP